jgi:hypothetical protein
VAYRTATPQSPGPKQPFTTTLVASSVTKADSAQSSRVRTDLPSTLHLFIQADTCKGMPLLPSSSTLWCLNCCKNTAIGITLACAMQATATPAILLARSLAAISIRALTRFLVSGTCLRVWGEYGKSLENGRRVVGDLRRRIRLRHKESVGTVVAKIYNLYHCTFNRILPRSAVSEHRTPSCHYTAHGLAAPARATALVISMPLMIRVALCQTSVSGLTRTTIFLHTDNS